MKSRTLTLLLLSLCLGLSPLLQAGDPGKIVVIEDPVYFDNVRRPITNPTLFDTALPQTKIHAVMMHQTLPDHIDTTLGLIPLGGDMQVYGIQAELALNERFSLVAIKDGYIDFQPENTLKRTNGWANISVGAKWAWLYQPESEMASAFQLVYEIPSGNSDVWQGEGDGQLIPTLLYLHTFDKVQYSNAFGFRIPLDDSESTHFYTSHHVGFRLTDWLYPLVEVNWFHLVDPGDGSPRFPNQAGGLVPAIARFEAGDLVNWGAANARANDDLVTLGIGFRAEVPFLNNADLGFAWEFPLTDEEASIMEDRFTLDLEIRF